MIEVLNPINSDQYQISPCNINAYPTSDVMRIKLRIRSPKVNFLDILATSPQYIYKKKYGDKTGEFVL